MPQPVRPVHPERTILRTTLVLPEILVKKTGLAGHVLGLQKIAETHADQVVFLFYAKAHTFAERQSDARQLLAGGGTGPLPHNAKIDSFHTYEDPT